MPMIFMMVIIISIGVVVIAGIADFLASVVLAARSYLTGIRNRV